MERLLNSNRLHTADANDLCGLLGPALHLFVLSTSLRFLLDHYQAS